MKAKGVGELGICGVGAGVANAIYNATGVRVRDYPITLDKLLNKLPQSREPRTTKGRRSRWKFSGDAAIEKVRDRRFRELRPG